VAVCVPLFYAIAAGWIPSISSIIATCRQKRSLLCHAVLPVSEWGSPVQESPDARKNGEEEKSFPTSNATPQQSPANGAPKQQQRQEQQQQQQCLWANSPGFWSRIPPAKRQQCALDGSSSDHTAQASSQVAAGRRSKDRRVRRWPWKLPHAGNLGRHGNPRTFWAFRKEVAPWLFGALGLGIATDVALCVAPHW